MTGGDWLLLQELLERGDPEFVDRLRAVIDADTLGGFAERWYSDPSPNARRLLMDYLDRPLNAYRHEALVKRLFKRAEAAGDDAVMARFLVAFDRSIRRVQLGHLQSVTQQVASRDEAERLVSLWRSQGYVWAAYWQSGLTGRRFTVSGRWSEPWVATPSGTAMPRGRIIDHVVGWDFVKMRARVVQAPDWVGPLRLDPTQYSGVSVPSKAELKKLEPFRLFSVPTRQYLRRRAWRYFRRLGKTQPERYVAAISGPLALYQDADVASGLALIDNWGLIHALFHHSPVLVSEPRGWKLAKDRSLSELEPAPIYPELWRSQPRALFDLMVRARCRPVRQWAVRMLRRDFAGVRATIGIEEVLGLLSHEDSEVIAFAVEWLRGAEDLSSVPPERWLAIAESASPGAVEIVAEIMRRQIAPERLPLEAAARLAMIRPLPIARLGLDWLRSRNPASHDERLGLLALLEAECEPLRPEILAWLRHTLASAPELHAEWLLDFLDSRHPDARAEGMAWFREEAPAREDIGLWQRLMESPYDDVRFALTAELDARLKRANGRADDPADALNPESLRLLWASVLLNVHRGSRVKPAVIEQIARRLGRRPDEADKLLPILAVGLRSLRAPERRAALAAVVRLVETRPESEPIVRAALPELQWA